MVSPRTSSSHGTRTTASSRDLAAQHHHHHHSHSQSSSNYHSGSGRSAAPPPPKLPPTEPAISKATRHIPLETLDSDSEDWKRHGKRTKKTHVPEDPRLARRETNASVPHASSSATAGHSGNGETSSSRAAKKRVKGPEKVKELQLGNFLESF